MGSEFLIKLRQIYDPVKRRFHHDLFEQPPKLTDEQLRQIETKNRLIENLTRPPKKRITTRRGRVITRIN
jgi:hypothetical protein